MYGEYYAKCQKCLELPEGQAARDYLENVNKAFIGINKKKEKERKNKLYFQNKTLIYGFLNLLYLGKL